MGHTVTGKLNKSANQFQAGESTGFGLRLGVKFRNRETGEDEWTNYEAAVFAKSPNQIAFYQSALVEGAIVSLTCESLQIKQFQGQNGLSLSLSMNNANLEYVHNPQSQQGYQQQPQYQQPQQHAQPGYQQPAQGGYQQPSAQQPPQQYAQQPPHGQPQGAYQGR